MKTSSAIPVSRIHNSLRSRFNPIRNLSPESLAHTLDSFHAGHLRNAALLWETIERRDDLLQGVASKRRKSISRLHWEILTADDSPEAHRHRDALETFYSRLSATHACDTAQRGSVPLLIKQMMDAIGKKYAVHEILWEPHHDGSLTATFRFVPLWFFENPTGQLRFLPQNDSADSLPLDPGSWLVTTGDGLMESCSIAYLFKHLPLRDWLIYCERNGMPGVRGITDALPGTPQWEAAAEAVRAFGAEFHALMSQGTRIEPIDLSSRGELPYPALVERMDRAMAALWRGADLATLAHPNATGASLQASETLLIEQDDAALISETLNSQVDRYVIRHTCGSDHPRARFHLKPRQTADQHNQLELCHRLWQMGVPLTVSDVLERFGLPQPATGHTLLPSPHNNTQSATAS